MNDLILFYPLLFLGLTQSFSHCLAMCGPIVATLTHHATYQHNIAEISLKKIKSYALLPYHFGRITTYTLTAGLLSYFRKTIDNYFSLQILQHFFLSLALLFFIYLFCRNCSKNFFHKYLLKINIFFTKNHFLTKINWLWQKFFTKFSKKLINNPIGWQGYLLGLILGFIPCGLLYVAYSLTSSFHSPILAMFGMLIFGLSTIPALLFSSALVNYWQKLPEFKIIANIIIMFNIIVILKLLFF
jgi:sulfite exporter TauE/SafE